MNAIVRAAAAIAVLCMPFGTLAQNYPVKPVRVVIPWPPGGSNDVAGRIVMQKLSEQMGQQFVIDKYAKLIQMTGAKVE